MDDGQSVKGRNQKLHVAHEQLMGAIRQIKLFCMTRKLFENTSLFSEIPLFKKMMETAMNFTVISGLNIPMNKTKTHEERNDRDLNMYCI